MKLSASSGDLFDQPQQTRAPMAERSRPQEFADVVGHEDILSPDAPLMLQLKNGVLPSLILWGPPGVGKTTLARLLAQQAGLPTSTLSAVTSGKKDLREVIDRARLDRRSGAKGHVLFIDEIHRYNKAQQDGLLHAVEDGTVTLIGATTENPSFEIIAPLLSRCQVLKMKSLSAKNLETIVHRALDRDPVYGQLEIKLGGLKALLHAGSGDARKTLNLLEICLNLVRVENGVVNVDEALVKKAANSQALAYDKGGDYHFDLISAFIKSIRGSDPDAAVYYLARMLAGGEDPVFIARRLIILASEDIGNAEPYALSLANAAMQAVHAIGMPEARIVLAQAATYLASCPKSNAAYLSISAAENAVRQNPAANVPLAIRNAPTGLMKELGYGAGYRYPHDNKNHFVKFSYLPDEIAGQVFYKPTDLGREKKLSEYLKYCWPEKYPDKNKK